jgi:hypothetical protein
MTAPGVSAADPSQGLQEGDSAHEKSSKQGVGFTLFNVVGP